MTVFLVACVLSLAILAITVFARRRRPNADALAPIFYVWLVAFLMWVFGVLVVLIVLAVIAAIGGVVLHLAASAEMDTRSVAEVEEEYLLHVKAAQDDASSFVEALINQILDSRRYYISVLVENSGRFPEFQGNGMVVSRSNDSEEIRGALGKNEVEILRVIRSDPSAGGSDNFVGEVHISYDEAYDERPAWWVDTHTDDGWFEELVEGLVFFHSDGCDTGKFDGSGNEKNRTVSRWDV